MSNAGGENYPIIIGAGQLTHRERILNASITVVDLVAQAIERCAHDTGVPDILDQIEALSVVSVLTEHRQSPVPGICRKAGISPKIQEETAVGGDNPVWLLNRAADKIMAGECKIVLLAGGEALYNDVHFSQLIDVDKLYERYYRESGILGDMRRAETEHEALHGIQWAVRVYPLFENALRAHLKMTPEQYRTFINTYFSNMARIAQDNPYAWINTGKPVDDVTKPTDTNPMLNYPYTKYMNPVLPVNQAAALILTDTRTARKLGVPSDKWVYLHAGSSGADKWHVSERVDYHSSPVARYTSRAALEAAGLQPEDISFYDLYTCFPCATLIAAMEIGLPLDNLPQLSQTGSLAYFGGPGNNFAMHSFAHAVERLRGNPREYGFINGWGNYLTKHSVSILSGRKPDRSWKSVSPSVIREQIDRLPSPALCEKPEGPATVETFTLMYVSPEILPIPTIIARLDDGRRCLAAANDPDLIARMEQDEFVGYRGYVRPGRGGPNIFSRA